MAYSFATYTSTGGQTYNVPFPYLDVDHVKVLINGVETTAFTWSDGATIHLNVAPAVGAIILIKRETPRDGMEKSFAAQPRLKGADLDEALLQAYYVSLEAIDNASHDVLQAYVDGAAAAQVAAELAETNAETAEDNAELAQAAAEQAVIDAGAAGAVQVGLAEDARDAAVVAQGLAEDAADLVASYAGSASAGTYMEVPSAPSTLANEVKMYAKDVTGVTELFIRKESSGAEVQVTSGSNLNGAGPHATSHKSGGGDTIKLDELDAPTDVTTLNATASAHGLLPKLSGNAADVLKGNGTWAAVSASPGGSDTHVQFNDGGAFGGDAGLVYNKTTNKLTCSNDVEAKRHMEPSKYHNGDSGSSKTIDWANGASQFLNLTGSPGCALTFSNPAPCTMRLILQQGTGGSKTVTWPTILWAGGVAPTLSASAGQIDIITLYYDGTNYFGMFALAFS